MPDTSEHLAARAWRWATNRPGWLLLWCDDEALARQSPQRFTRAWLDLMLVSLVWGLVFVGVWGLVWRTFRDFGMLTRPAAAVLAVFVLLPYRRATVVAAEILGRREPVARAICGAVLVVVLAVCLLGLEADYYRDIDLPVWIAWLRPEVKFYRVLVLMPLWGAWAMLIAPQFCRPGDRTEPALAALARGCSPSAAAACMGVLLATTIQYFNYLPWTQLTISAVTIVTAIAGGLALCRHCGGLTRCALLAANLLTQMAFLLAYLANR